MKSNKDYQIQNEAETLLSMNQVFFLPGALQTVEHKFTRYEQCFRLKGKKTVNNTVKETELEFTLNWN